MFHTCLDSVYPNQSNKERRSKNEKDSSLTLIVIRHQPPRSDTGASNRTDFFGRTDGKRETVFAVVGFDCVNEVFSISTIGEY